MSLFESFSQDANGNQVVTGIGTAGNVPIEGAVTINGTPNVAVANTVTTKGAGTAGTPDTGVLSVQGVSGGVAISVKDAPASAAAITSQPLSITSVSLLAANPNRKGLILWNTGTKAANVAFAASASLTSYSFQVSVNGMFESNIAYTGAISVIWQGTGTGAMLVTELT